MIQMPRFPDWIFINDETLTRNEVDNLVKSEMETGPQKTRPKQSRPLFNTSFEISFSAEKYNEWISWKNNEINYGASWFVMNDPFNGERIIARIVNNDAPMQKRGLLIFIQLTVESYNEL